MPVLSKEFLYNQATIECGFTLKRVRDMIRTYSLKIMYLKKKKKQHVKYSLKQIYGQFPVKLIAQANGSVVFLCKRFYLKVVLKEFNISRNEQTKCTEIHKRHDFIDQEIINKHSQHIKNNFNIPLDKANKCLSSIYWLPQLHKSFEKFRDLQ